MSSSAAKRISLVWFKNSDLRLHDHLPLIWAHDLSDYVIHLFVFDDFWFKNKTQNINIKKTGSFRCKFLIESVLNLRTNLNKINSQIIIRYGSSSNIIKNIINEYNVNKIYYHSEICSEEKAIVQNVIDNNNNTEFISFWGGNTMYIQKNYHLIQLKIFLIHLQNLEKL